MDPESEVLANTRTPQNSVASSETESAESAGTAQLQAPDYGVTAGDEGNSGESPGDGALWDGSVTASRLNVRRGNSAQGAQVRQVARDTVVSVYEISEGWYRISASTDPDAVEWVSGTYIQRVGQETESPEATGDIPQVDLTGNGNSRAHNRWEDDGEDTTYAADFDETIDEMTVNFFGEGMTRDRVMEEIDRLETEGRMDEATAMRRTLFIATQHAVVDVLDVENNQLYAPGGGKTYCNIYAYDFVTAMGAYIPRVWWSEAAIGRIQRGEQVTPRYGETIFEMNANALNAWMPDYGVGYGWRRVDDMDVAQQEANSGKIVVILAANANARRSGHITVILSETEQEQKGREDGALPLSSQAGSSNHERHRPSGAWWANSSHRDGAAWVFDGTVNSPLMSPEQTGIAGTENQSQNLQAQIDGGEDLIATNYLLAVQQLEAMAAEEGYTTVQTLSAIRKLYYNSGGWDTAISGAADTGIPRSWVTLESKPLKEAVARSEEVSINGVSVDVGHILTGLDSTNHNGGFGIERMGFNIFSFRDNKEFTTYVGDIGSAVEAYIDERRSIEWFDMIARDDGQLMKHYDNLAGDLDMAGNADSYAMDFDPTISFSQNLINYTSGETRADDKRYTKFAEGIGLGQYVDGAFSLYSEEWKDALASEISSFAQAYQMRDGAWEGITEWGGLIHYNKVARWMTDIFVSRLTQKVQAETTSDE